MNHHPVVIKLGGSLLGQPLLQDWLAAIHQHARGRAVIVPGGGQYADAVREQVDLTAAMAHYQAMLAMRQAANDCIALHPAYKRADSLAAIARLLAADETPIAVPVDDWLFASDIPASWDWTSDSLALWLADRLQAERLLLVKSVAPDDNPVDVQSCSGIVDAAFADLLTRVTVDGYWAGPATADQLPAWLAGEPLHDIARLD